MRPALLVAWHHLLSLKCNANCCGSPPTLLTMVFTFLLLLTVTRLPTSLALSAAWVVRCLLIQGAHLRGLAEFPAVVFSLPLLCPPRFSPLSPSSPLRPVSSDPIFEARNVTYSLSACPICSHSNVRAPLKNARLSLVKQQSACTKPLSYAQSSDARHSKKYEGDPHLLV